MILPWLILIPFIGGLLCWLAERMAPTLPRWIALFSMTLVLGLSLWLWGTGNYNLAPNPADASNWAVEFKHVWIERFGINLHLALDGLSLLMIVLTGLLGVLSVLCSWSEIQKHVGFFHLNLMWILGGVIGVFLAMDLFLFFFFWEMMLVPMFFLIALWGHSGDGKKTRITAATKFFIYTQASGLIMLAAILGLVFAHHASTGVYSFDYAKLIGTQMPPALEYILMLGFFIAFAVKLPVVPVHSWLPDAHAQAPTAGSVDLAGILLKTAAYGLLRFALPLFPDASAEFAPIAMGLGLIGIFYGAFLSFAQTDIKRLVAYSSVSHMGFVLIGIYSGSQLALQGAVVQMVAHGLSAAALFILCGQLYERLGTRDMRQMGGLWSRMPWLPALSLFFAAASLGLPGTGNFVGEFLILFGSFGIAPWVVVVATGGLVLASVYSLIMIHRAHFGPAQSEQPLPGLNNRELFMVLGLAVLLIGLGVYPQTVLDTSAASMQGVQQWLGAALSQLASTR
jgi:NADH-quinone oxidoreductase subunit M